MRGKVGKKALKGIYGEYYGELFEDKKTVCRRKTACSKMLDSLFQKGGTFTCLDCVRCSHCDGSNIELYNGHSMGEHRCLDCNGDFQFVKQIGLTSS